MAVPALRFCNFVINNDLKPLFKAFGERKAYS